MDIMDTTESKLVHATVVAVGGRGVLIQGSSGSGKSDLALRLLDRGADLVTDDYALLWEDGGAVFARAPETIFGKLEVRGVGIIDWPAIDHVRLALRVLLSDLPSHQPTIPDLPTLSLSAFSPSAPVVVERALARLAAEQGFDSWRPIH